MEGPSLYLASEQLAPFVNKKVLDVEGNTRIGKARLAGQKVLEIFSRGKHLVIQFQSFALRMHFMLYGSYEAVVNGLRVSGDYPKKGQLRLALFFNNGELKLYNCSLQFYENESSKDLYDFSVDVMSSSWDAKKAFKALRASDGEIGDLLLDQTIFSGIGNIIRNEVLFTKKILPTSLISILSDKNLRDLIVEVKNSSLQFYEWRKLFVLKKHFLIYRKSECPICLGKVTRKKTGSRGRISFFCPRCQH